MGFAALVALTRRTAEAQTSPDTDPYPYVGCYKDEPARAMSHYTNAVGVTKDNCASMCIAKGNLYFGLQFGHEW